MKNGIRLLGILSAVIGIMECSCKKSSNRPLLLGTVIGFDPCTADWKDSSALGYVIKIEKIQGEDTAAIDTALTYNLPKVFVFHPGLFVAYQFTYLFPPGYRNKYRFRFSYVITPKDDVVYVVCLADIWLAPIVMATNGEQITIKKFEEIH